MSVIQFLRSVKRFFSGCKQLRWSVTRNGAGYVSSPSQMASTQPPNITLHHNTSVCLSVCQFICPSVCSSVRLSVHPSVCLFIRPSVCSSVHLSVHPSVCLFIRPSVCSSVHLSVHPSICLFIRPSVSLSIMYIQPHQGPISKCSKQHKYVANSPTKYSAFFQHTRTCTCTCSYTCIYLCVCVGSPML